MKKAILLAILSLPAMLFAQQTDSVKTGIVKGKVKDSIYNYVLSSATVAVYKAGDSSLMQFTIPNNFGEFTVQPLPLNTKLRIVITHVGFIPLSKTFTITPQSGVHNFGQLYMYQDTSGKDGTTLQAVVVRTTPPVQMNGDTLEFNADAFKIDKNATAEDLMRRLPGFTIWGDGDITFNGKKINSVLVEGKPFMGGSITVATQNLPKDAIDKIQVYQQRNDKNPLDSTLNANIKLKDDKKTGYFGKVSGGYGTRNRYAADGMISGFNRKMQISAIGAANNINKIAGSTDVLIENSSYKGEGNRTDYQSDFTMLGLNQPVEAGLKFQYDFLPGATFDKTSRLNADYFLKANNALIDNRTTTNTILGKDSLLTGRSVNRNNVKTTNQNINGQYERNTSRMNLAINAAASTAIYHSTGENRTEQEQTGKGITGISTSRDEDSNASKNITIGAEYGHHRAYNTFSAEKYRRIPTDFTLGYTLTAGQTDGNSKTMSQNISFINPADNRNYNRFYRQKDVQFVTHAITAQYPGLKQLIFGKAKLANIDMGLSGSFNFDTHKFTDDVLDLDTSAHDYRQNTYLTNTRRADVTDIKPAVSLSRRFDKMLTNRFSQYLSIDVNIREQYYALKNKATQAVQNIRYDYYRFIPDARLNYHNHQYGSHEADYSISFNTSVDYPDVSQIAPLIDSSNYWYLPKGNVNLKPEYQKELLLAYQLSSRKPKNPWEVSANMGFVSKDDAISDSTFYDDLSRRVVYFVNIDGYKSLRTGLNYRKSFETKHNTYTVSTNYSFSKSRLPQYINNVFNLSNGTSHTGSLYITYSHGDVITLGLNEILNFYHSGQKGFNNDSYDNRSRQTQFSGTLQYPKRLFWNTNVNYNKSGSNNQKPVYYTIWNASLTYRFLKGNQGEVKFSALDLLHQNKGIINAGSGNTQTFTYANVLQQYFLVTLSYYPRRFGKREEETAREE